MIANTVKVSGTREGSKRLFKNKMKTKRVVRLKIIMRKIYGYIRSAFEYPPQGHCWQMHFGWFGLALKLCGRARAFPAHLVPLHGAIRAWHR